MKEYTLNMPPIRIATAIRLIRKWSDWNEGDLITMDSEKAKRVIAKGYGVEHVPQRAKVEEAVAAKGPAVETMMQEPAVETAVVTPRRQKRRGEDTPAVQKGGN